MNDLRVSSSFLKALSFALIAGGAIGILISIFSAFAALKEGLFIALQYLFVYGGVNAFACFQGVKLWNGNSKSLKWAGILFFMQIPSFSYAGFTYSFHTLFKIAVVVSELGTNISTRIGSSFIASQTTSGTPSYFAVNIFAFIAFAYILFKYEEVLRLNK